MRRMGVGSRPSASDKLYEMRGPATAGILQSFSSRAGSTAQRRDRLWLSAGNTDNA